VLGREVALLVQRVNEILEVAKPGDKVRLAFDVAFPKPILNGPKGTVLEVRRTLRGKNLDSMLSRHFERK
jgi:hypothetical protein